MEKKEIERLREEVSRILFEVWDPIGVNDLDDPEGLANFRSEYREYEIAVLSSLLGGMPEEQIASQLLQIASKTMGVNATYAEERSDLAAKALVSLRVSR